MKPGPKPKNTIALEWSGTLAYAVGLLTADGCLSKDGRHLDFTSKDKEQILSFKKCLGLSTKIGIKYSGAGNPAYYTQFGNVRFYAFLLKIGLTPAKSKTLSKLKIPGLYFPDFLRGYFDGDGCSVSYFDPKFVKSYRFYISFTSASSEFTHWLRQKIFDLFKIKGHLSYSKNTDYIQLKYAKKESIEICRIMYHSRHIPFLKRKYLKIRKSMSIISSRRSGEIGRRTAFRTQRGQPHEGSNPSFGTTVSAVFLN